MNQEDILKDLFELQDLKYKEFNSSLILNSKYQMIGIRIPDLRKYANKINDIEEVLKVCGNTYFGEIMLQGMLIAKIKDEGLFYKYFREYIKKIDNWSLCDTFISSIKIVNKNKDKYFKEAIKLSLNKKEFISRVGLLLLRCYFIDDIYLKDIFNTLDNIVSDQYYVNMAEAWLLCDLYIKYPNETKTYLSNNKLNDFTVNKTISKIHDSYRVCKTDKEYCNRFRR